MGVKTVASPGLGVNEVITSVGQQAELGRAVLEPDRRQVGLAEGTFVLGPGLRIFSMYNGYWYWGRPSNEDLRRDLRMLTRKIRPDWDLGAPGLREKWVQGQRDDDFWPYSRSPREVRAAREA